MASVLPLGSIDDVVLPAADQRPSLQDLSF